MMRVAALYDIHGNLPALEAVLEDARAAGVDEFVVGGDVVPGPMPGECLSALKAAPLPVRWISGNGERAVLNAHFGRELTGVPAEFQEVIRWVAARLSAEHIRHMAAWPLTYRTLVPGQGEILFCHATPRDDDELFTRITPEARLRPIFDATGAAAVICGHTHMQFDRRIGDVRVLNAGSVGMPFGDPGAYWVLIADRGVELRRTSYDLAAAAATIASSGYPTTFDPGRPASEDDMTELFEAAALK